MVLEFKQKNILIILSLKNLSRQEWKPTDNEEKPRRCDYIKCVCICVYVCVCTCVYTHVCTCVVCVSVCIRVWESVCECVRARVSVCVCVSVSDIPASAVHGHGETRSLPWVLSSVAFHFMFETGPLTEPRARWPTKLWQVFMWGLEVRTQVPVPKLAQQSTLFTEPSPRSK